MIWGRGLGEYRHGTSTRQFVPNEAQPRARQTKPESLIWTVLRAKRLAGLKFRRPHPIATRFGKHGNVDSFDVNRPRISAGDTRNGVQKSRFPTAAAADQQHLLARGYLERLNIEDRQTVAVRCVTS